MPLQITTRLVSDVLIVDLAGRCTIGPGSDLLNARLREAIEGGVKKLLVNLAGVSQIDSSGITTIVRAFVTLQRSGGSLRLVNPRGHVREALDVTRLLSVVPWFEDEARALTSFHQEVG